MIALGVEEERAEDHGFDSHAQSSPSMSINTVVSEGQTIILGWGDSPCPAGALRP
jgi:hypothetical protein